MQDAGSCSSVSCADPNVTKLKSLHVILFANMVQYEMHTHRHIWMHNIRFYKKTNKFVAIIWKLLKMLNVWFVDWFSVIFFLMQILI